MSYIPRLTIKSTSRTADFMSSLPNHLGKVMDYLKIQKYGVSCAVSEMVLSSHLLY